MLDQEAMGVIVRLDIQVSDLALGDQLPGYRTAGTNQFFCRVTSKRVGELVALQPGAVHFDLLGNIRGDQVIIIA